VVAGRPDQVSCRSVNRRSGRRSGVPVQRRLTAKELGTALHRACSALEVLVQRTGSGASLTLKQERSLLRFKEKNVVSLDPTEGIYDMPVDAISELSKLALGGSFFVRSPM
jgi:hypothetical protein